MEQSVNLDRIRAEYNVKHWSQGFYGIDDNGEVYVSPSKADHQIPLRNIVKQLEQKNVCFEILNPRGSTLTRTGQTLKRRNGLVEPVYFDAKGLSAQYRIYTG